MFDRIWRGEIGLGWAFFAVGSLGLYPILSFVAGSVALGALAAYLTETPLGLWGTAENMVGRLGLSVSALLIAALALISPNVVIWRGATGSGLVRIAAHVYVLLSAVAYVIGPPLVVLVILATRVMIDLKVNGST